MSTTTDQDPPDRAALELARHEAGLTLVRLQPIIEWARTYAPDLLTWAQDAHARAEQIQNDPRQGFPALRAASVPALPPARPPEELPGLLGSEARPLEPK